MMNTNTILRADNLTRYYKVKKGVFGKVAVVKALSGASFTLQSGKTLAIVGESGCGKSTLARVLTMIDPPSDGKLEIAGQEISLLKKNIPSELRQQVQIVFQNPYGSLNPRKTVASMLKEPLILNTSETPLQIHQAVQEMMDKVGLRPEHADRYPHMFSGGQRQRIAIARALMLRPKILILDEPVSALDLSIQAQILNLLSDLQQEFGLAYIFISHDLSVVRRIAEDVIVMYFGKPIETGPAQEIFARSRHPYTQALLSATPVADPKRVRERIRLVGEPPSPLDPPPGCAFAPRCPKVQPKCSEQEPQLQQFGEAEVRCFYPLHD